MKTETQLFPIELQCIYSGLSGFLVYFSRTSKKIGGKITAVFD